MNHFSWKNESKIHLSIIGTTASPPISSFAATILLHECKVCVIFFSFLFVNICLNVCSPPCPTYMRPEPLVPRLDITSILPFALLCLCLVVHIFSHIDLNCRFISFNTRLNTLTVPAKERSNDKLNFFLLVLSYLLLNIFL